MRKVIAIVFLLASAASLQGCASLLIGGLAGAAVYHHEKCTRWVDTAYGVRKISICGRRG